MLAGSAEREVPGGNNLNFLQVLILNTHVDFRTTTSKHLEATQALWVRKVLALALTEAPIGLDQSLSFKHPIYTTPVMSSQAPGMQLFKSAKYLHDVELCKSVQLQRRV